MPTVVFTDNLKRHIDCPPQTTDGATVGEALEQVFEAVDHLRGYILDEQSRVRPHVMIFVDSQPLVDRMSLTDPVLPDSEIYVMQALSGG